MNKQSNADKEKGFEPELNINELSDEQLQAISGGAYYLDDPVGAGIMEESPYKVQLYQQVYIDCIDGDFHLATILERRCAISRLYRSSKLWCAVEYYVHFEDGFDSDCWINQDMIDFIHS